MRGYCLNHLHPRGKNKARVFSAALGLTIDHADILQKALFDAAKTYEATLTTKDIYGQRYVIDFIMSGPTGVAMIRSAWIIRAGVSHRFGQTHLLCTYISRIAYCVLRRVYHIVHNT